MFLEFARFPWMTARREGEHTILEYYDLRFGAAPHYNNFRLEVVRDGGGAVKHIRLNHRFNLANHGSHDRTRAYQA